MLYHLSRPLLFCLDPEKAHHLAMWGARRGGETAGKKEQEDRETRHHEQSGLDRENET